MSNIKNFIEISPFRLLNHHNLEEQMILRGFSCPQCCGRGQTIGRQISQDECEINTCKTCDGKGALQAVVTINWMGDQNKASMCNKM